MPHFPISLIIVAVTLSACSPVANKAPRGLRIALPVSANEIGKEPAAGKQAEDDARPGPSFSNAALQGDVRSAAHQLDGTARAVFERRYIAGADDAAPTSTLDPLSWALPAYRAYWRETLLDPDRREQLEVRLAATIRSRLSLAEGADPFGALNAVIARAGFGAITGRTPPLLELIAWTETDQVNERVLLTDGEHIVPVTYMQNFVSRGWSHFATFGRASTGGWADRSGLHCVCDDYDRSSEKFTVSFLKHEGRHYVDYSLYPNLGSADLEYRAKLTEIVFSDLSLNGLLNNFASTARVTNSAPHSLANWYVINDLAEKLVPTEDRTQPVMVAAALQRLPANKIQEQARALIVDHDRRLRDAGAKTTTGVISVP